MLLEFQLIEADPDPTWCAYFIVTSSSSLREVILTLLGVPIL